MQTVFSRSLSFFINMGKKRIYSVDLQAVQNWLTDLVAADTPNDKLPAALANGTHLYGRDRVEMQGTTLEDQVRNQSDKHNHGSNHHAA